MTEQYYTCTLLSDVVLNNKMATEGNMTTLDYIAGSNFLGVVAGEIYAKHIDKAYSILHSGEVSFGDAHISLNGTEVSYAMPFSLFKAKPNGEKEDKPKIWLHHLLKESHFEDFRKKGIQLKQERKDYLTPSGHILESPKKNFALKSAQDRDERRSKDGAMFGFESLKAGQVYVFSVRYKNAEYQQIVEDFLIGKKRIGKSKTAQYGQVCIEKFKNEQAPKRIDAILNTDYTIVYAESNLCFFNEFGQTTFQPEPKDLGLSGGQICWKKSQIRTYAYSPWNGIRNTPNTQRDCILKGSVFYVKDAVAPEGKTDSIGEYHAEGLGRVIYNPLFLKGNESDGDWTFDLFKQPNNSDDKEESTQPKFKEPEPTTDLGKFLNGLKKQKDKDLAISKAVQSELDSTTKGLKEISPSQWGGVRAYATKAKNVEELRADLFEDFLTHGISAEKYWDKDRNRETLRQIFERNLTNEPNQTFSAFLVKYAAEMAKEAQKLKNKK